MCVLVCLCVCVCVWKENNTSFCLSLDYSVQRAPPPGGRRAPCAVRASRRAAPRRRPAADWGYCVARGAAGRYAGPRRAARLRLVAARRADGPRRHAPLSAAGTTRTAPTAGHPGACARVRSGRGSMRAGLEGVWVQRGCGRWPVPPPGSVQIMRLRLLRARAPHSPPRAPSRAARPPAGVAAPY